MVTDGNESAGDGKQNSQGDGKYNDPVFKTGFDRASRDLLLQDANAGQMGKSGSDLKSPTLMNAVVDEIARKEGYDTAAKSRVDAEVNWNSAFPEGTKSVSKEDLQKLLQDKNLAAHNRGYIEFIDENFSKIAGLAEPGGAKAQDGKDTRVSLSDMSTLGGLNEIDPARMRAAVDFMQSKFFELSSMDNKVSSQRIERMLFDHSFQLFPKDVQEKIYDLTKLVKSADQRLENFEGNKRVKSGLTEDDARALDAKTLTDNLRIQELQKSMFGRKFAGLDGKTLSADAKSQYESAARRYAELQKQGLDEFLEGLRKD